MTASIIVVLHNSREWIEACLSALLSSTSLAQVVLVDNGSSDDSVPLAKSLYPSIAVHELGVNRGFGAGINRGVTAVDADVVVVLNPDVVVNTTTVSTLVEAVRSDPKVAVVGCKLSYPNGTTIQHAGGSLAYPLALPEHFGYGEEDHGQYDQPRDVDYVTGACFAIRRSVFTEVAGFDEGFFPAYFEETDFCYRVHQAGYKVIYEPRAVAVHHESVTTGKNTPTYFRYFHRNRLRFVLKHFNGSQLWSDFLPAELHRLRGIPSEELSALYDAYGDNLAVLKGCAGFLPDKAAGEALPNDPKRIELCALLQLVAETEGGRRKSSDAAALNAIVRDLADKRLVVERPFRSPTPVLGPLIARGRALWNWMSTTWYVRPLTEQQNAFNRQVVDLGAELIRSIEELQAKKDGVEEAAFGADRLSTLHSRQLARVQRRLLRLEALLDHREGIDAQQDGESGAT